VEETADAFRTSWEKVCDAVEYVVREIIRDLNQDPSLRKVAADRVLSDVVHANGGPLIHNGSEEAQRSFDSTCRKLHRFLSQTPSAESASYPQIPRTTQNSCQWPIEPTLLDPTRHSANAVRAISFFIGRTPCGQQFGNLYAA
jgi:hypothetical protein